MLIITQWMDMLVGRLNRGNCALSMTDSSTSAGWLRKTNFREIIGEDADAVQALVHIETARHHATLFGHQGVLPMVPGSGEQHQQRSLA
jgi:hypothetical protein